jgi:hypothetical protein
VLSGDLENSLENGDSLCNTGVGSQFIKNIAVKNDSTQYFEDKPD